MSEMHWNFRVIAHVEDSPGEDWMGLHEVYYRDDKDGQPVPSSYAIRAAEVMSTEGVVGLRWQLDRMREALDKPVLAEADFPTTNAPPGFSTHKS